MRRICLMCLAGVVLATSVANAFTVWNPELNPLHNPSDPLYDPNATGANWNDAANWTFGIPDAINNQGEYPVFSTVDALEAQVTDTVPTFSGQMELDGGNIIRVMDGGTLTQKDNWSGIGWTQEGTLIVEEGGVFENTNHHWLIARNGTAKGTVIIDGGTGYCGQLFDMCKASLTSVGRTYVNEGLLEVEHVGVTGTSGWYNVAKDGLMDIRWGTFVVHRDIVSQGFLPGLIDNGKLTGFGGTGTVSYVVEGGWTTVTANHPLAPFSPGYKETVLNLTGTVPLSWTALDPNAPGDSVLHTVTFGTDPNKANLVANTQLLTDSPLTTADAPVTVESAGGPYYWWVDTDNGASDVIEGDMFIFYVTDDSAPTVEIVDPNVPTATWINQPVPLTATVTDSGSSALNHQWTASDPGAVFTNESLSAPVDNGDGTVTYTATADVAVDNAAGDVTVTCTVSDAFNVGVEDSDTVLINVSTDQCTAAVVAGASYPMDADGDCDVDIDDLLILVGDWTTDYAPLDEQPIPTP